MENFFVSQIFDWLLGLLHNLVVVFNLTGFLFARLRKLHLVSLFVTALSWTVPGYWYGWGYCFLTDIHYQLKAALGERVIHDSYIHYQLNKYFALDPEAQVVDMAVVSFFILSLAASFWVNFNYNIKINKRKNEEKKCKKN